MVKTLNIVSVLFLVIILFGFLSERFFPINGLELFYQKKFYFAIGYILIRLYKNFLIRKEVNKDPM